MFNVLIFTGTFLVDRNCLFLSCMSCLKCPGLCSAGDCPSWRPWEDFSLENKQCPAHVFGSGSYVCKAGGWNGSHVSVGGRNGTALTQAPPYLYPYIQEFNPLYKTVASVESLRMRAGTTALIWAMNPIAPLTSPCQWVFGWKVNTVIEWRREEFRDESRRVSVQLECCFLCF